MRATLWSAAGTTGRQLASLIVFLILARLMEPATFGLVAYAAVFTNFMNVFLRFGFSEALIQDQDLDETKMHTAFWTGAMGGVLMFVVAIAVGPIVATLMGQPKLGPLIQVLGLGCIVLGLQTVPQALLSRNLKFRQLGIALVVSVIIGGVIGVAMAYEGYGPWALVVSRLSTDTSAMFLMFVLSRYRPGKVFRRSSFMALTKYGSNILTVNVLDFFSLQGFNLFIGYFLGEAALGYYTIAMRIIGSVRSSLIQVFRRVALPAFSIIQDDHARIESAIYRGTRACAIVSFPIFFGIATLAPDLILITAGEQWVPSTNVMRIMALLGPHSAILVVFLGMVQGMGKPSWLIWQRLTNVIANYAGFVLVYPYGIAAVAGWLVLRAYVLTPIPIVMMRKLVKFSLKRYFYQFASPLGASLCSSGTAYAVNTLMANHLSRWLHVGFAVMAGAIMYGTILLLIEQNFRDSAVTFYEKLKFKFS